MSLERRYQVFYDAWKRTLATEGHFVTMGEVLVHLRDHHSAVTQAARSYRDACDAIAFKVWEKYQ